MSRRSTFRLSAGRGRTSLHLSVSTCSFPLSVKLTVSICQEAARFDRRSQRNHIGFTSRALRSSVESCRCCTSAEVLRFLLSAPLGCVAICQLGELIRVGPRMPHAKANASSHCECPTHHLRLPTLSGWLRQNDIANARKVSSVSRQGSQTATSQLMWSSLKEPGTAT